MVLYNLKFDLLKALDYSSFERGYDLQLVGKPGIVDFAHINFVTLAFWDWCLPSSSFQMSFGYIRLAVTTHTAVPIPNNFYITIPYWFWSPPSSCFPLELSIFPSCLLQKLR